jgi:hypothetical protein
MTGRTTDLPSWDSNAATGPSQKGGNLQVKRLFCKRICKPDAAGQGETGETTQA